jgi:hypothetical protein
VREPLGVRVVRGVERRLAHGAHFLDASVEDIGRREECEAGVMVLVVVPAEELLQPPAPM